MLFVRLHLQLSALRREDAENVCRNNLQRTSGETRAKWTGEVRFRGSWKYRVQRFHRYNVSSVLQSEHEFLSHDEE